MTSTRSNGKESSRAISIGALLVFAMLAGGCLSVPSASVVPSDVSTGHTVLLVGDSLMGGAAASLASVLHDSDVNGISIVDEHRNGSGLVRQMDDMSPANFVEAQFTERPDIDIVAIEWGGACEKPCPEYGTPAFFQDWFDSGNAVRAVVHAHGARLIDVRPPPPPPGSSPPDSGYNYTDAVAQALAYFAGPTPGATAADWWTAFAGIDGLYYDTLFYDAMWHTVRIQDRIHFTLDGRIRAAKVLAAAIESSLGIS